MPWFNLDPPERPNSRRASSIRVEDNTDENPKSYTRYFAHVYLSRAKARAGVEHWAERGGHGTVRWEEHEPASYAYAAGGQRTTELYRIVPLRVHLDDEPEP